MVKAPIVSRDDDHKRYDLRNRPPIGHFITIFGGPVSARVAATHKVADSAELTALCPTSAR